MKILISGATGLIGKEVGKVLAAQGHKLLVISRNEKKARLALPFPCEVIEGDLTKGPLHDDRLSDVEAVINLIGESVVGSRWNAAVKNKIYDSRVLGTRHLIASLPSSLKTFVGGSAIGLYGDRRDQVCHEDHPIGKDFLAQVTQDWEAETAKAPGRVCMIRTGIVLSSEGGALKQMLFPFKAGVGGFLGDGKQWMSWIDIQDIVGLFIFALENENVRGPLNGVAPFPVTNKVFSEKLASSIGRSLALPVPSLAIKVLFGEAAGTILSSIRCSADRAKSLGYQFKSPDLMKTLEKHCTPYKLREEIMSSEQFVPCPPEQLFEFFRDPKNLEEITPPTLSFHIKKVSTPEIQQGTLIDYILKIHGVPAKWKTEIDEWSPPFKFVDNQLQGPYKLWHHTHEFRPFCGGTLMVDRVRYKLPLGYLGWLIAGAFVRKDVQSIFNYRREYISRMK